MRIDAGLSKLPVETQIDAAVLGKSKKIAQVQGQQVVKLIESALDPSDFVNNPLSSGPVGTKINIAA